MSVTARPSSANAGRVSFALDRRKVMAEKVTEGPRNAKTGRIAAASTDADHSDFDGWQGGGSLINNPEDHCAARLFFR